MNALFCSALDMGCCLAGVGKNDTRWANILEDNLGDFAIRSTIKAGAKCCQEAKHEGVWITFHSVEGFYFR
jgi:hypothetical protein